jgi:hypothetical protein
MIVSEGWDANGSPVTTSVQDILDTMDGETLHGEEFHSLTDTEIIWYGWTQNYYLKYESRDNTRSFQKLGR